MGGDAGRDLRQRSGVTPSNLTRILAGICVVLAAICVSLAVAYGRQAEHTRCVETWASYGLPPPAGKCG